MVHMQGYEATEVPNDSQIDRQNVINRYNGTLYSPEKRGNSDKCILKTFCSVKYSSHTRMDTI